MSFISFSFIPLYLLALAFRWLPQWFGSSDKTPRIVPLLALSWVFYAWHIPWYIVLILVSTCVDYLAARWLTETTVRRTRQLILACSLLANLGLLGFFKYAGFFVLTLNHVSGSGFSVPDILLPVGISFYTFQSMSYTIDVYRGRIQADRSFLRVACYIAFFPQLVAGPIVRATDFLYQFQRRRRFHASIFTRGAYLILRGLFLKMVVADNLGTIVDQYWSQAAAEPGAGLALSMLFFFSCQLFCDFAGYVDIARGVAYQLGFRLPVNFNAPFLAATFSDFWRRWHITLSQWMRDYVYLSLGGNRKSRPRVYLNLLLVMLISGLWHGANWNYVIWGGVLGVALVAEKLLGVARPGRLAVLTAGWFVVVQLTWVLSMGLFRSDSLVQCHGIILGAIWELGSLFSSGQLEPLTHDMILLGWWFTLPVFLLHGRCWLAENSILGKVSNGERTVYSGVMLAALLMLYSSNQQFIYFQF